MIKIWDYFMRRKGLLLAMLLTFSVSGMLSYRILNHVPEPTPTYIPVNDWGDDETVEIPKTGGEQATQPFFAVASPSQVAEIKTPPASKEEENTNRPFEVVEQPKDLVKAQAKTIPTTNQTHYSLVYTIFLAVMGLAILGLGGYLTYWHFRR